MPILLDNSVTYPSAHGQPAEIYNEIKVHEIRNRIHTRRLEIQVQYGNTVEGVWKGGRCDIAHYVLQNIPPKVDSQGNPLAPADPRYDTYMATTFPADSTGGTQLYQENAQAIYKWLQAQEASYAGTIQ